MDYFPSKKFAIRAATILALFVGWFVFFGKGNNQSSSVLTYKNNVPVATTTDTTGSDTKNSTEPIINAVMEGEISPSLLTIEHPGASSTPEELHAYGNNLRIALAPYAQKDRKSEVALMLAASQKGTSTAAKAELSALAAATKQNTAVKIVLLAMPVPPEFAELHALLVTEVLHFEQLSFRMQTIFTDPISALAAGQQYAIESTRTKQILTAINALFTQKGITFAQSISIVLYETE